jgi:hydrogenase small subunit
MAETVVTLANKANCAAIIPIGQCATFGGYPGCKPPISAAVAGFDPKQSQTGAMGTYDYLVAHGHGAAANKVINVPGCPTNPWWFVLTVVMFLVDLVNPARPLGVLTPAGLPNAAAIDTDRRLKAVYGTPIHGPYCPRYRDYVKGDFAAKPGDPGCLQKIGCKGPAANSLCGMHGWNGQQPQNAGALYGAGKDVSTVNPAPNGAKTGGHCTRAGHPCMACTEKGYPDAFVPFIARS